MKWSDLTAPFHPYDIEWRISQCGMGRNNAPYAKVLAYVTNRAIMDRLDSVIGPDKWKNEFMPAPGGGVMCGISIRLNDEWITKWDGADNTNIEAVKGGLSGAMKRAAVQWGIGRYLYRLTENYAVISDQGAHYQRASTQGRNQYPAFRWDAPKLPDWAIPELKK